LWFLQLGLDISPEEMADLGIGGIGGAEDDDDDDDDEESLEAELAALQGESRSKVKKRRPVGRSANMMDDEEMDDDDDDDDNFDENDPQLLAELQCIAPGEDGAEHRDPTPVLLPSTPTTSSNQQVNLTNWF